MRPRRPPPPASPASDLNISIRSSQSAARPGPTPASAGAGRRPFGPRDQGVSGSRTLYSSFQRRSSRVLWHQSSRVPTSVTWAWSRTGTVSPSSAPSSVTRAVSSGASSWSSSGDQRSRIGAGGRRRGGWSSRGSGTRRARRRPGRTRGRGRRPRSLPPSPSCTTQRALIGGVTPGTAGRGGLDADVIGPRHAAPDPDPLAPADQAVIGGPEGDGEVEVGRLQARDRPRRPSAERTSTTRLRSSAALKTPPLNRTAEGVTNAPPVWSEPACRPRNRARWRVIAGSAA